MRSLGPSRRNGSRTLEKKKGVWGSWRGEKDKHLFFTFLCLSHKGLKGLPLLFKPRANDYTTKQPIFLKDMFFLKLCTNDYMTTVHLDWGYFSFSTRTLHPRAGAPHQEMPLQWEAYTPRLGSSPCWLQLEKSLCSSEDPAQPKLIN